MIKLNVFICMAMLPSALALADTRNGAAEAEPVRVPNIEASMVDASRANAETASIESVPIEAGRVETHEIKAHVVRGVRVDPYAYEDD